MIDPAIRKRALFREVNVRIRDVSRKLGFAGDTYEVFCECTRPDCLLRIEVTGEFFDEVVADGRRYLVASGHERVAEGTAALSAA